MAGLGIYELASTDLVFCVTRNHAALLFFVGNTVLIEPSCAQFERKVLKYQTDDREQFPVQIIAKSPFTFRRSLIFTQMNL
jgi:hypothetical protein